MSIFENFLIRTSLSSLVSNRYLSVTLYKNLVYKKVFKLNFLIIEFNLIVMNTFKVWVNVKYAQLVTFKRKEIFAKRHSCTASILHEWSYLQKEKTFARDETFTLYLKKRSYLYLLFYFLIFTLFFCFY